MICQCVYFPDTIEEVDIMYLRTGVVPNAFSYVNRDNLEIIFANVFILNQTLSADIST